MKPPHINSHARSMVHTSPSAQAKKMAGANTPNVVASRTRAPNYTVQAPLPLGAGNHQIRATIQGTPQVAGSGGDQFKRRWQSFYFESPG